MAGALCMSMVSEHGAARLPAAGRGRSLAGPARRRCAAGLGGGGRVSWGGAVAGAAALARNSPESGTANTLGTALHSAEGFGVGRRFDCLSALRPGAVFAVTRCKTRAADANCAGLWGCAVASKRRQRGKSVSKTQRAERAALASPCGAVRHGEPGRAGLGAPAG